VKSYNYKLLVFLTLLWIYIDMLNKMSYNDNVGHM